MTVSKIFFDRFLWTKIQGKYFQDINEDESITNSNKFKEFFKNQTPFFKSTSDALNHWLGLKLLLALSEAKINETRKIAENFKYEQFLIGYEIIRTKGIIRQMFDSTSTISKSC